MSDDLKLGYCCYGRITTRCDCAIWQPLPYVDSLREENDHLKRRVDELEQELTDMRQQRDNWKENALEDARKNTELEQQLVIEEETNSAHRFVIDELEQQLEAAEKDARRLDFLELHNEAVLPVSKEVKIPNTTTDGPAYNIGSEWLGWSVTSRWDECPTIREAIDAAMKEEQE